MGLGGGVGKYPNWDENVVAPIKVPKVRNL